MESIKSSTCNKDHSYNGDDLFKKNENLYVFINRHNHLFHTNKN